MERHHRPRYRQRWRHRLCSLKLWAEHEIPYQARKAGGRLLWSVHPQRPSRLCGSSLGEPLLYPVRGKSSTDAFPHLGQKYKKFVEFAKATLPQIYTRQCLDDAHEFEAAVLESGILLNNGSAKFTFEPLPRLAQIAPGFGIGLTEINGDGKADLYLLQNFFGNQHETGRMDGGVSLLLSGNGDGTFEPIWPKESGLIHYGDAKALATTDLNRDGKPDFITTANNANPIVFLNQGTEGTFTLRLQGSKGNPTANRCPRSCFN